MEKKIGLSVLALIISGCVLLSAGVIAGAYFLLKAQKNYVAPTVTVQPVELPLTIAEQMDQIQQEVLSIRGMPLNTDLQRDLMTPAELQDKVVNEFFADYTDEDAEKDVKILSTLGLLEPGFDLRQFYLDLYSEQVAGYYDSTTKEMYVIAGEAFGGLERMTYAHEFTHVLQDQNYDLENGLKINEEYCKDETEYCAAVTALIEGDATLTEQLWFLQNSTAQDRADIDEFQRTYSSPIYDSAPEYMKQDFLFPYSQGYDFVNQIYGRSKFRSVDEALKDPPVSTEQILHPEKYPKDVPVSVDLPDFSSLLGGDWQELDRNVMGEWYSYLILSSGINPQYRLSDKDASGAAAGWGGDTYEFAYSAAANQSLFAWRSTWDTRQDAREFFAMSSKYGQARWGSPVSEDQVSITWDAGIDGVVTMRINQGDVLWLMGSEQSIVENALSRLPDFGD